MNDLVSREYMKSLGATCIASRSKDGTLFPIVSIDELPSVRPRKGKWIYGESEIGNDGYYCSVCGNFVPWKYDEYDIDFIKEFLFCNKCGSYNGGEQG